MKDRGPSREEQIQTAVDTVIDALIKRQKEYEKPLEWTFANGALSAPGSGKTISEAKDAFIHEIENNVKGKGGDRKPLSDDRLKKYKRLLKEWETFCGKHGILYLNQFVNGKVRDFRAEWKDNPHKWAYVKKNEMFQGVFAWFVEQGVEQGFISKNPVSSVDAPDIDDEIITAEKCFTKEQKERMLAACDHINTRNWTPEKMKACVLTFMHTGMRISCMSDLSPADIDKDGVMLRKALKNGKRCTVALPPFVTDALAKVQRSTKAFYFNSGNGALHSATNAIDKMLREVWRLANVDGNSHMFRHTFISEALAKGTPVEVVADMVGDSPEIIRKHYKHFIPEAKARVVAASRAMWA
jgi:site-specific recombinase XerD